MRDIFTVVIMSSAKGSMRQYTIGRWTLRFYKFLCFILIAAALTSIGYGVFSHQRLRSIQVQNERLNNNVESQKGQLDYINKEMQGIREMADMVRRVLGIDDQKGVLGQGGGGYGEMELSENEITELMFETTSVTSVTPTQNTTDDSVNQVVALRGELGPIHGYVVENLETLNQTPSILPIQVKSKGNDKTYWYSSGFGPRIDPLTKQRKPHNGLDIATRTGTPVVAAADGVITRIYRDKFLGRMIQIDHQAAHMKTVYGHLSKYADGMRLNRTVKRGEVIGFVGNSGRSTGPHLHYGIRKKTGWINPKSHILD